MIENKLVKAPQIMWWPWVLVTLRYQFWRHTFGSKVLGAKVLSNRKLLDITRKFMMSWHPTVHLRILKEQTAWVGNLACDESVELLVELCKGELTADQSLTEAIVVFVLAFMHCCIRPNTWPFPKPFPTALCVAALLHMKTFAGAIMTRGNNEHDEQSSYQRVQGCCQLAKDRQRIIYLTRVYSAAGPWTLASCKWLPMIQ